MRRIETIPEHQKMPRRKGRLMSSVYPEEWVHAIIGWGSVEWNQTLEFGAAVLAGAAEENVGAFTPEEWEVIGERFCGLNRGRRSEAILPADHLEPAAFLAAWMSDRPDLAEKLSRLDYTHSWAIMRAAAWRSILDNEIKTGDEWWRPSYWKAKVRELYELVG